MVSIQGNRTTHERESFRNKDGDSRENVFIKNKLACFSNCAAYIRHIPTHLNSCQRCVNLPVDEFLGPHPSLERERKIYFLFDIVPHIKTSHNENFSCGRLVETLQVNV